jgi:transcriptional regulator with XRE-family HTH domain
LRREEVALLAGVSADYYIKLERGNARGVSDSVLEALSRALHLDEAERAHLFDLAAAVNTRPRRPEPAGQLGRDHRPEQNPRFGDPAVECVMIGLRLPRGVRLRSRSSGRPAGT